MYFDRSQQDLSDETIIILISISVESYDEKTAGNYRNCYAAEKRLVFKLLKILILNFDSIS